MVRFLRKGKRACERPSPVVGRLVLVAGRLFPPKNISTAEVAEWLRNTHSSARWNVVDFSAFAQAKKARWDLRCNWEGPHNSWPVEVWLPDNGTPPKIIVYSRSVICRLRGRARDAAGQAAIDHAFAHIYLHYAGAGKYTEEDACWLEHRLRRRHTGVWHWLAQVVAPGVNFALRGIDPRVFGLRRMPTDDPWW